MSDDIVVNIAFKGNANEFLAQLSRAVGTAKTQLQEMGQSTAALSRLETQLAKMAGTANTAAQATTRAAQATQGWAQKWTPFKGQFQQAEASSKALWRSIDTGITASERSIGRASTALANFDAQQRANSRTAAIKGPMADWDKQFAAVSRAADDNVKAMQRAKAAVDQYQHSLSNTRYVLYDVAGTLSILGLALVAPVAAVTATAINFEKAFAQVERTSGATGKALQSLKSDFDDLYGSIPITYEALAQIATLGGQLGVPFEQLADFTEVVAKTSAVTNLSVDQAATAFGRLNALIPNVKGQYDRLGSSIATVGVNSVATESEIVNIATQISSMGTFAGLTAQDIVGLSGALASVGAQPELSRGTLTRVFSLMSAAVAKGGEDLENFAKVSGVSANQFAQSWGTPQFTDVFLGFMQGIAGSGKNAVSTLNELGITSVRDVPLLMRLAGAADSTGKAAGLLAQTVGDANKGWAENVELQRQFAIISGTVSAKFDILVNNFNLLLQAVGAPMLSGLGDFLDLLTDITKNVRDFAETDLGGTIIRITVVMTALVGVLAVAGGAMALMGASSIGLYQALLFVSAQSPRAAAALVGVAGAAGLADGTLKAGAASALLFSRALKAITIVGAILILPELLKSIGKGFDEMAGRDFSKTGEAINMLATSTDLWTQTWQSGSGIVRNVAADFTNSLTATGRAAMALDDQLKAMVSGGQVQEVADYLNQFNDLSTNVDAEGTVRLFTSVLDAARDAGYEVKIVGDKIKIVGEASTAATPGANGVAASIESIAAEAEAALTVLDEMKASLDAIGGAEMSAAAASDAMYTAINNATTAMQAQDVTLDGVNDASIEFRDNLRNIETKARDAAYELAEQGGTMDEVTGKYNVGREAIINMLTAHGLSRDAAVAWADTNLGKSGEVVRGLQGVVTAAQNVAAQKPVVDVKANTWNAQTALDNFVRWNSGRSVTIYTHNVIMNEIVNRLANPYNRAAGGPVFGPGSATSDDIPAMLSNGEFVLRTRAARAIGYGRLNYMNQTGKLPAFADGGMVGSGSNSNESFHSGEIDLGPRTMRALSRQVVNMIQIDQRSIATAANNGNAQQARRGGGRNH